MKNIFALIIAVFASISYGADHCVKDTTGLGSGNYGSMDGSDWDNAYPELPATLTRGDTYYIAYGNYGSYECNDPVGDSSYIYIKKAVDTAHGIATGWNSSYGDGQAIFTVTSGYSILNIMSSYYYFDGVTGGGPENWFTGYGIKLDLEDTTAYGIQVSASGTPNINNINISHIEIEGNRELIYNQRAYQQYYGGKNIYIGYCYFHDVYKDMLEFDSVDSSIIEYNFIGPNGNSSIDPLNSMHSAGIVISNISNFVVRYNFLEDLSETGYICLVNDEVGDAVVNFYIYGNIFYETRQREGTQNGYTFSFARENTYGKNIKFYNNTIANRYLEGGGNAVMYSVIVDSGGNEFVNNIWHNNYTNFVSYSPGWGHTYNYYSDNKASIAAEDNIQLETGDPFTDMSNRDFSLVAPTNNGASLSAYFSSDMFGTEYGSDGVWDRGAIEYGTTTVNDDTGYIYLKIGE